MIIGVYATVEKVDSDKRIVGIKLVTTSKGVPVTTSASSSTTTDDSNN